MSRNGRKAIAQRGSTEATGTNRHHPSEEEIRVHAFERYCKRNGSSGDAVTDWLEAERELEECGIASVGKH